MQTKTKIEALRVIHSCALMYQQNLLHKNILFVAGNISNPILLEAAFLQRNFKHLTGVASKLRASDFYKLAVRDRLTEEMFSFSDDGTTQMKLEVLPTLMNIHTVARMIGDYNNSKSFHVTDKMVGTISASMGFVRENNIFIPNTALSMDLRDISCKPVFRILAIFIKNKNSVKYAEHTYIAKGISIDDIHGIQSI